MENFSYFHEGTVILIINVVASRKKLPKGHRYNVQGRHSGKAFVLLLPVQARVVITGRC